MMKYTLFAVLVGLFIGVTACTPTNDPLPTALVQATVPSLATNTPTPPLLLTHTIEPTPEFTPLPTFGPSPTPLPEQATATWMSVAVTAAAHQTEQANLLLTPTSTPLSTRTPTPTPTYVLSTPAPDAWRILFLGGPCPPHEEYCDDDNVRDEAYYFINSDGSGLVPVTIAPDGKLALQTAGFWMRSTRFSSDGTMVAYSSINGVHLLQIDGTELAVFASLLTNAFDFLPESDCVVGYLIDELITVAKACADQPEIQTLATVAIPESLRLPVYHLSPQGDALLIYGVDLNDGVRLYVKNFADNSPPSLIYHEENLDGRYMFHGPVRWAADGKTIDFVVIGTSTSAYTINSNGENLTRRFSLTETGFGQADWSPNGQQLVFQGWNSETVGLFILDFNTGEVRSILPEFYIASNQMIAWNVR